MVFTYLAFHALFTAPPLAILTALYYPFYIRPIDTFRLIFFCCAALVWTTPWDNWLVYRKAWWYCERCVVSKVGWVPVEEYAFFITQSVTTTLLTLLITRWSPPVVSLSTPFSLESVKAISMLIFGTLVLLLGAGYHLATPFTETFYLGAILLFALPPLMPITPFAWPFYLQRWRSFTTALAISTVYLWYADIYALRRGTWHINEHTSLKRFPFSGLGMGLDQLPMEEALFFFVSNLIIVAGNLAVDRCLGIMQLFPEAVHGCESRLSALWKLHSATISGDVHEGKLRSVESSLALLRRSSPSFHTAAYLYPPDLRLNLSILYALLRATDDMIDDPSLKSIEDRRTALSLVYRLIEAAYDHDDAVESLRGHVSKAYVLEVVKGYEIDLDLDEGTTGSSSKPRGEIKDENDLIEYAQCVAGSVGGMCTELFLSPNLLFDAASKSTEKEKAQNKERSERIVQAAREMGIALQLTNIARDILTDSTTLGRCYIPTSFFSAVSPSGPPLELKTALTSRSLECSSSTEGHFRALALNLLDLSDAYYNSSVAYISQLPRAARGPVRAACEVYREYGRVIRERGGYPERRVRIGKWRRMWVGLMALLVQT